MNQPEILAPAGTFEALTAAVRCGADAVYLGGQHLNARRGASNFDDAALCEAVRLCHEHGAKLYLTLNTLVSDSEADEAKRMIEYACRIGVDALIVQDMGVVRMARACSDIPLHASTQMSVQMPGGVQLLRELGFTRAVVPRELSREELREIRRSTDLELEMFVHGALCMSVSGQCLMSAVFGGRSGNRGLCAQPCRLPFSASGGTGHDLSLRDLSLLHELPRLREMGIESFKIEGRMKRPEYVAAAVTACRKALDGAEKDEIFDALRRVFSRSGFTDGYYTAKRGVSMFGTRQKEDVTAADGVFADLQKLYCADKPLYPVRFSFVCTEKECTLTASSGDFSCTVQGETPSAARSRSLDRETVEKQLGKCGGTLFYIESIETKIADGLFLPAGALNALRRDALERLLLLCTERKKYTYTETKSDFVPHHADKMQTYVRFADAAQIPASCTADKIILPLYCGAETIAAHHAAVELPRALFGRQAQVGEALLRCKQAGVTEAVFGTLDGLRLIHDCGMVPIAGFGSNIYNTEALEHMRALQVSEVLLSPELTLAEAFRLGGTIRRGIFAYGRLPLMLTRNCPQRNGKTCDVCRQSGSITDRKGVVFTIECRSGCAEILNSCPVYLADKQARLKNADFMLLYFTKETQAECAQILEAYRTGEAPQGDFTRGLSFRGVE